MRRTCGNLGAHGIPLRYNYEGVAASHERNSADIVYGKSLAV